MKKVALLIILGFLTNISAANAQTVKEAIAVADDSLILQLGETKLEYAPATIGLVIANVRTETGLRQVISAPSQVMPIQPISRDLALQQYYYAVKLAALNETKYSAENK